MKLSLQNRITTLIILSSILVISTFTFIQLNNQLDNINRYNSYLANLSSASLKNNLENIIKQVDKTSPDLQRYMLANLNRLQEAGIIKDAQVFDREGKIVAATDSNLIATNANYKDLDKLGDLEYIAKDNKWFISEIDKDKHQLVMYLALRTNPAQPISYITKVSFSLGNIQEAFLLVFKPVILTAIIIIALNILFGYLLSGIVIGPIKILNRVTKTIAAGNLAVRTDIHSNDEFQELGDTFNYMAEQIIKMKDRAENANPLTKLPGNIVIREEIDRRISAKQKFVVIYCDLDNFKAFNDKYGIAKGDEAIKMTADIFKEAVKKEGDAADFVGHEGGDDFILITSTEKAENVANYITAKFGIEAVKLYNAEDLERGYIVTSGRDGVVKQFPIMTISLAGVTNEHRDIITYVEITNIAAEVKKKAKSVLGNIFILDKRRG